MTPVVPVLVGDDWKAVFLWKALYEAGVFVNTALHPAVPPAGALLRTSVMATHDRPRSTRRFRRSPRSSAAFESEHGPLPAGGRSAPGSLSTPAQDSAEDKKGALSACHRRVTLL